MPTLIYCVANSRPIRRAELSSSRQSSLLDRQHPKYRHCVDTRNNIHVTHCASFIPSELIAMGMVTAATSVRQ